jgi:quercetin dioxygenase-like cupin family protein
MQREPMLKWSVLALCGILGSASALADSRTELQDQPFPGPERHSVMVRAEVDPGSQIAPHMHPGLEMGFVMQGQAILEVAGQPPRSLSAGDSFAVPPMTVHDVRNTGTGSLTLITAFVVDTGKPVLIPVHKRP